MSELDTLMLKVDLERVKEEIICFIKRILGETGRKGVVVGVSGGVDSSVVLKLSALAIGEENVFAVLMPTNFTPKEDVEDGVKLTRELGVKTRIINIDPILSSFSEALDIRVMDDEEKILRGNIIARIRMTILYYFANKMDCLVAGSGDKSEILLGYFTKYGDGGVDFMPIAHLYKTQVRALAKHIGVPEEIFLKPSSPQLYPGHKATDELPLDYDKLDLVLAGFFDLGLEPSEISRLAHVPLPKVEETIAMCSRNAHKRRLPPSLLIM